MDGEGAAERVGWQLAPGGPGGTPQGRVEALATPEAPADGEGGADAVEAGGDADAAPMQLVEPGGVTTPVVVPGHAVQLVAPAATEYVPLAQPVQDVAPATAP